MTGNFQSIQEREKRLLLQTYPRYPLSVSRAKGTRIYDHQGREYLDLLAGISVCNLGHCHPELTEVLAQQSQKLIHVSNLFYQEEQLQLAERLLDTCSMDKVFFCNSGAEANEAAIKLARRYMQKVCGKGAFEIVTLEGSFHGRTLATLTATGQQKVREGFDPLPEGFSTVPLNDLSALKKTISAKTAAVLVEIFQGEGGVTCLSAEYLRSVQSQCRQQGILFMVDEIQSGMGRTGKMWAHQLFGLEPDVFTTAKALANGLPAGAMLTTEEAGRGFGPGSHGTTFGGGALVAAVGTRVLDIIHRDGLCQHANDTGQWFLNEAGKLKDKYPEKILDVRGKGLMLGVELAIHGQYVWESLLQEGFICNLTQEKILRILPPLIIEAYELKEFLETLDRILSGI